MGAFLCFMGVRLLEMRRVLRDDGSLYLHCDPTASHYLKLLMDAMFGRQNFRIEVIWSYRSGGGSKRYFGRKHDVLLLYTKSNTWTFNADDVRIPYDAVIAKSREHLFNKKGKVPGDVWDISRPPNHAKEWVGFPTQKPLSLYERVILASSNEGDWVLDPFAGCATTCVAAERLGRQWVGIDLWEGTHEINLDRLKVEGLAGPDGDTDRLFTFGDVTYTDQPPERTDKGESAAPFLKVTEGYAEPDGPRMSRAEMLEHLVSQYGCRCQGCDRTFDDVRYLQLDPTPPRGRGPQPHHQPGPALRTL